MSKHTPGPWSVTHFSRLYIGQFVDGAERHDAETASVPLFKTVATIVERTGETDANARLIAAAPELLEACKDLVKRLVHCTVRNGTDKEFAEIAVAPYRAIIAKAEGETK
jgi:hypothetical protein